jgi:hypothetical protein
MNKGQTGPIKLATLAGKLLTNRRRAVTLIELLVVVIATIASLGALLLPALSQA